MRKPTISIVLWMVFAWMLAIAVTAEEVRQPASPIAEMSVSPARIDWLPQGDYESLVLTVAGPEDFYIQRTFGSGEVPFFSPSDGQGGRLPDGIYAYELRAVPRPDLKLIEKPWVQSGYLWIQEGSFVDKLPTPRDPSRQRGSALKTPLPNITPKDIVQPDDLIVQGQACIGSDCVNGDADDGSTLKLKEIAEPKLVFQSTDALVPWAAADWSLQAGDVAESSGNFLIRSLTDNLNVFTTPVKIGVGAPDNSLTIQSGVGVGGSTVSRIGMGTLLPAVSLDVKTNDAGKATARLQNSSATGYSGTEYLNNAGTVGLFFGIDNAGSTTRLNSTNSYPIVILTNSTERMRVTSAGNIGIGTASPTKKLTVKGAAGNDDILQVVKSSGSTSIFRIFETTSGDGLFSIFDNTGAEAVRFTSVSGGRLAVGCNAPEHDLDLGNAPGTACSAVGSRSFIDAGSTIFTASSSRSIKENLRPLQIANVLDKISEIGVYSFDFIDGPKDKIGLMAEDFHTVFEHGSDKLLNGQEVEMALWLAVQELTAQNKKLAAQNEEISEQLAEIQARLATGPVNTP